MCLARKVIGYTVHFLFAFLGGRYIGTFEVGDADIIRFTGKVIIGHHSQLSGKTESHFIFHLFRRQPDGECLGFFLYFAREHFRHSRFLLVQIVKHQLELGAVLGHIVCFAAQEGILAFADAVYFLSHQLGHLGTGVGHQYFFRQKTAWVNAAFGGFGFGRLGSRLTAERNVDGADNSVFGKLHKGCYGLVFHLHEIDVVLIRYTGYAGFYLIQCPELLGFGRHVVETQIAVGISAKFSGSVSMFGGLQYDFYFCFG